MADRASFKLEGDKKLEKSLVTLGLRTGLTILRRAGRAAMLPTKKMMEAGANYDGSSEEKHMRDSISITSKKGGRTSRQRAMQIRVGPTRAHNQKAVAQEYGTSKQAAKPFIRPAGRRGAKLAIPILRNTFKKELDRVR